MNQEVLNLTTFLETCPKNFMETSKSLQKKKAKTDERESLESLLMVITFHSLEEKLVSQAMARWRKAKLGEVATKKVTTASEEELVENSRSKSAKLHCFLF